MGPKRSCIVFGYTLTAHMLHMACDFFLPIEIEFLLPGNNIRRAKILNFKLKWGLLQIL